MSKNTLYTQVSSPTLEARLNKYIEFIKSQLANSQFSCQYGIYLGGGYGRGDGGVWKEEGKEDKFYNDLDFFVFTNNASNDEKEKLNKVLEDIAISGELQLGIDVDFAVAKEISILQKQSERLMNQELIRGNVPIVSNIDLSKYIIKYDQRDIPLIEGIRVLVNRAMGLLLAAQRIKSKDFSSDSLNFILRNLHKCALGSGDALLIGKHCYQWKLNNRVKILKQILNKDEFKLYSKAVKFKLSPHKCDDKDNLEQLWKSYAKMFKSCANRTMNSKENLSSFEFYKLIKSKRQLHEYNQIYNLLRWIVKTRCNVKLEYIFYEPLTIILKEIYSIVEELEGNFENNVFENEKWKNLYKYWEVFN